jgi:hypothetical protein
MRALGLMPRIASPACAVAIAALTPGTLLAADQAALINATVTVDAGRVLRTMDPQRLGGTNVAMWYFPSSYDSPVVQKWMGELRARYIRMPGGSWSNVVYWNGNGVRGADGNVDTAKIGPDGYPAVDYSSYAPSFLADPKTLHPASGGWHGHVDVKKQHEFIKAIPGSEAMACPNAGTGRAVDAMEWVKWANKKMGYDVRYWEIGNELGGSWEAGTELPFGKGPLTAEMYTQRYNDMAGAMRKVDPTIKIGGCPFVAETLRDGGTNVDFVSIHTYPGSTTLTETQMFGDVGKMVAREVGQVKGWIHRYQPLREKQIEIAYSEWNLAGGINNSQLFSGLWSSIFLGEMARNDVAIATQWDCFSDLLFDNDDRFARKPEFYALSLWNNYMGNRLIPATSDSQDVYTFASRSDDAVSVMLINTDRDREANVNLHLSDFSPAPSGELATVSSREYYYDPLARKLQWSTGPHFEKVRTGTAFGLRLSPFSMTYLRIPSKAKPGLTSMARKALASSLPATGKPELRFVLPAEMYAGDQIRGELIALSSGSRLPYQGHLGPATLGSIDHVSFDRTQVRLSESVGHFFMTPSVPGQLTLSAQVGDVKATHRILVKPSTPRPVIFWDFLNPRVTDQDAFSSSFSLSEDLTQRANRAVARVSFPELGIVPDEKRHEALKVAKLPDDKKLNKENIRGVIFDLRTPADFACEDPNANILVVMQSSANWWMKLGTVSLSEAKQWRTYQFDVKDPDYIKAMPSALNIIFVLQATKPVKGSIYFDHVGFMVR